MRDSFVNLYRNGGERLGMRGDNPNVGTDSRSLTWRLASSINEKRDFVVKLKCER
jgi:hypothetical protein